MNREIKFRALKDDMDNCNWVYGNLIYSSYGNPRIQESTIDYDLVFTTCLKGTEGQFTGLKDKNGKEIYEGDLVKGNHKDMFIIERINGAPQMYNYKYYGQPNNELISEATCDAQTAYRLRNSEIIGNIHENPELLTP